MVREQRKKEKRWQLVEAGTKRWFPEPSERQGALLHVTIWRVISEYTTSPGLPERS